MKTQHMDVWIFTGDVRKTGAQFGDGGGDENEKSLGIVLEGL